MELILTSECQRAWENDHDKRVAKEVCGLFEGIRPTTIRPKGLRKKRPVRLAGKPARFELGMACHYTKLV